MTLMVTSLWHHPSLHPRGLVPNSKGPQCQFRGDWSEPMASLTSESVSNTFAECHLSYYSFSLTTDISRVSQSPLVPALLESNRKSDVPGVRVHFPLIYFWLFVDSPSSPVNGHSEGRWSIADVGIHSYISTKTSSTLSELLYSVVLWIYLKRFMRQTQIT